jgi:hypothetical protein
MFEDLIFACGCLIPGDPQLEQGLLGVEEGDRVHLNGPISLTEKKEPHIIIIIVFFLMNLTLINKRS